MPRQVDSDSRRFAVLVVDDEGDSLLEIRDMLALDPRLVVAGAYTDPQEVLAALDRWPRLDFAFIDIKMPAISGLELGEILMRRYPALLIVYVTAYNDYATEAFEIDAVDYVLKPVREERLWRAVDRLVSRMKASERLTSSSDHPELAGPGKARAVRVQCFGGLELLIDGRTVRWPTRKSSELFAYLLHNNGKYVSKDRIVDDLWPDQGYENALVNLHTAVYRTRLALAESGGRLSIDYENGKYRLRMTDVSCDLQEFEGALEQSGIYPDKAIPLLQQALRAYTGGYLEEQSYIWCVDFQESLRRKHVACLKGLASRHLSNGDADKAIPLLEIAVAKTQYDPVAVDLLFTAYVALRDVDSMVAFYEKVHERQADKVGKNGLHLIEERFIEGYRRLTGRTLT